MSMNSEKLAGFTMKDHKGGVCKHKSLCIHGPFLSSAQTWNHHPFKCQSKRIAKMGTTLFKESGVSSQADLCGTGSGFRGSCLGHAGSETKTSS